MRHAARIGITVACLLGSSLPLSAAEADLTARQILAATGVQGGLIVHVNCGDGRLTAALRASSRYLVQGLQSDAERVAAARTNIQAGGLYGPVSVIGWNGKVLPYAERMVNLLLLDGECKLAEEEILRVLAPRGVAYAKHARQWTKTVKPWPAEIDEWPQYLHAADGNPVAHDQVVGPPRHYQWIAEPLWLRDHDTDSSINSLVTAQGRIFYLDDEAPTGLTGNHSLPDRWFLVARDAFNGLLLWKTPIRDWGWRQWKQSWFQTRPGDFPLNLQKRLLAVEDRVYATLGYHAAVSELDAATGKVLQTYAGTEETCEILSDRGELLLSIRTPQGLAVRAIRAADGRMLWQAEACKGTSQDYIKANRELSKLGIEPTLNSAADARTVVLLDGKDVVAFDRGNGRQQWRTTIDSKTDLWVGTLMIQEGVVVQASKTRLVALAADSGKLLWEQPKSDLGHLWYEWKDVFVIDGRVWTWSAETRFGDATEQVAKGKTMTAPAPTSVNAYNLHSGVLEKQVPLGNLFVANHHHRCYRNRATDRYILARRRGTEFVDLAGGENTLHNWVRGVCHFGMLPANGLQYVPPHPCVCYLQEKLNGFNALAAEIPVKDRRAGSESPLFEKGPAFASALDDEAGSEDWPLYRCDASRSASAATKVPALLDVLWQSEHGSTLTAPIVAGGKVFAARIDEHRVLARNAADGRPLWTFTADARIDSPPAFSRGRVVFGCRDGWVYCLRAADGGLVWKFRAASQQRQIGAFNQLESVWPVSGSILIYRSLVYFAAGRSSHLDGGIYLYGLDLGSGKVVHQTRLEGPKPDVKAMNINFRLPEGAVADILQVAEDSIITHGVTFDENLEQRQAAAAAKKTGSGQSLQSAGLSASSGFLDDSYFKRTPWRYQPAGGQHGNLFAITDTTVFGMQMFESLQCLTPDNFFTPGVKGYSFFAIAGGKGRPVWSKKYPLRATALVATGEAIFAAGPPDVVDPADPLSAFEGRMGGVLLALDPKSGAELARRKLDSPPVFNGMAAAKRRLFITSRDGRIVCLGGR